MPPWLAASFRWVFLLLPLCIGCQKQTSYPDRFLPARFLPDQFLIAAVDARGLDYSSVPQFLHTLHKSRERSVGHAWVIVGQKLNGQINLVTLGHTGEFGVRAPRFLDQLAYLIQKNDPNPLRVLYQTRDDGVLEQSSGGHRATLAVCIPITQQQALAVQRYCQEGGYDFSRYNILNHHCVHFVRSVLAIVGVEVDCEVEVVVPKTLELFGRKVQLWNNPELQILLIETPEKLQAELARLLEVGKAQKIDVNSIR